MQLLLLLTGRLSSEARVLESLGDPGRDPKMLYPDRGIPPNTTGATDRCKSSEELYYKLEQGLSSHIGEGVPSERGESFLYCTAGEAGREA